MRNEVVDIEVSKERNYSTYLTLALRLEERYKIKILCTDGYEAYRKYKIASRHLVTKSETCLVESKNSLIRHYLARLNRRTKRYTKSIDMLFHSIFLFFNRKYLKDIYLFNNTN